MLKSERYKISLAVAGIVALVFVLLRFLPPQRKPRDYMFSGCLQDPGFAARTFDLFAFYTGWVLILLLYAVMATAVVAVVYYVGIKAPILCFGFVRAAFRKALAEPHRPRVQIRAIGSVLPGLARREHMRDILIMLGARFIMGNASRGVVAGLVSISVWLTLFVTAAPQLCLADTTNLQLFHLISVCLSFTAGVSVVFLLHYVVDARRFDLDSKVSQAIKCASNLLNDGYGPYSKTDFEKSLFGDLVFPYVTNSNFGKNFRVELGVLSKWRACAIVHEDLVTLFFSDTHRSDVRTVYCVESYRFSTKYPGRAEVMSLLHGKLLTLQGYGGELPADVAANGKVEF